jgi:hydroxymethylglutaryl-CoA lyase
LKRVKELAAACGVELVVYLSMSFGNPYKEVYHQDLVMERWEQAVDCGADIISISDTTGVGSNEAIAALCQKASSMGKPWGAHLHSAYDEAAEKALTAIENGCRRIDTALRGFGGCPFAQDSLIGNMPTEKVLSVATAHGYAHELNALFIESSYNSALKLFGAYS